MASYLSKFFFFCIQSKVFISLVVSLELGLILNSIFIPLPSQIFLSNCWKILGHLVRVFTFLYGLKITRTVEKSSGSYLTVLNSFRKKFGGLFFSFSIVSSFSHLLSSRPSRLFLLPCFWFFSSSLSSLLTQLSRKFACRLVLFSFSP
jgi:hypothetical protein